MNHLETDRAHLSQTPQSLSFARNRRNALSNCRCVVGTLAARLADPFDVPFGQNGLAGHIQDAILEGSAADIWNQAFHVLNVSEHF
jgi:hypothetical protein